MYGQNVPWKPQQRNAPLLADPEDDASSNDWEECDEFGRFPTWDNLWDAFDLDDEMAEPQPEYGDFWAELDDEEEI